MGVFFTTFLLLQIILLFLYKAFIVDIAKKNEENLVENTLQIYHNTMESVLDVWMITWIFFWGIACF